MPREPMCFFNGRIIPDGQALIHVNALADQMCYETIRTFGGKLLTLDDHLDRLLSDFRYFGWDLGMPRAAVEDAIRKAVDANRDPDFERRHGDYLIGVKATPAPLLYVGVTSLVAMLKERAPFFRTGLTVATAATQRHVPPQSMDARVKCPRPWFRLATQEIRALHPDAWPFPLVLDTDGNVAEFATSNLFLVKNGALLTPARNCLMGCTRKLVLEAARAGGIPAFEKDLQLYDVYNADEAFMTAATFCMLPIAKVDHARIQDPAIPGPLTRRLMGLLSQRVGLDFVAQHLEWEQR